MCGNDKIMKEPELYLEVFRHDGAHSCLCTSAALRSHRLHNHRRRCSTRWWKKIRGEGQANAIAAPIAAAAAATARGMHH